MAAQEDSLCGRRSRRSLCRPSARGRGGERTTWKSRESVHNRHARDRPNGLPARFGLIRIRGRPYRRGRASSSVTFEPGARTAWHTHPLGQTLIVTAGAGARQRGAGRCGEEIRPGDVVWFPPGEKHWHGAAATTAMTHIAVQEKLDGKAVDWMEHVTTAQYEGRSV